MNKVCIILFHRNALKLFDIRWISKSLESLKNQTYQDFDVLELDYGDTHKQLYETSNFESVLLPNHAYAMNYLIAKAKVLNYHYVFNWNIDDYYAIDRLRSQLAYLPKYDVVSGDHVSFREKSDRTEKIVSEHNYSQYNGTIPEHLKMGHNVIAHPCVAWKMSFFENFEYQDEIPKEDLKLWQRAITSNKKFFIVPRVLLYYRIHDNQITQKRLT